MNTNRQCPKAPYVEGQRTDSMLLALAKSIRQRMVSTKDNCTILCFGATGSGKSTLGFHFGDAYNESKGVLPSIVGFDAESWAHALQYVNDKPNSFLMHDEANISRRRRLSAINTDTIDLLFNFRLRQYCLWMNNPSLDYIDKVLVEEGLINYFVFIYAKQRRYYWFGKNAVMKMLKDHGSLKYTVFEQFGHHYALYDGYFYSYKTPDWALYMQKKNSRVSTKMDEYIEKYGKGKVYSMQAAAKKLGMHENTVRKRALKIFEGEKKGINGYWQLTEQDLIKIEEDMTA